MADLSATLQGLSPDYAGEINKYAEELKATAKKNYDFIVKYLKQQHELALGTDDQARAKFYEDVANNLEKQIGRIPFDFNTKTQREKEDIANYLKRSELTRQGMNEQEKIFNEQQAYNTQTEQQKNAESANARGLLGSGIQEKEARRLALARKLFEQDPYAQQLAQKRAELTQQDAQAQLQSGRNLQDITTAARRGAQDENLAFNKGSEGAQLNLDQANQQIDIQANQARQQAIALLAQQRAAERAASSLGA